MIEGIIFEVYYEFIERHMKKYSFINGRVDEDLRQKLAVKAYECF